VGRDCRGSGVRATRAAVAPFAATERGSGAAHKEECGSGVCVEKKREQGGSDAEMGCNAEQALLAMSCCRANKQSRPDGLGRWK
jgi:hypothetical protein